eukprot:FR735629.1.p3 GENE.FR735629.1~~FR735629.1.p3  ORF type:complete len:102 (+),score=72.55 FR735629.1:823-1128(+)
MHCFSFYLIIILKKKKKKKKKKRAPGEGKPSQNQGEPLIFKRAPPPGGSLPFLFPFMGGLIWPPGGKSGGNCFVSWGEKMFIPSLNFPTQKIKTAKKKKKG